MSHEHKLRDTDPYFRIDPDTRVITDLSDKGTTIVQNDHNSEKFTFELPRFIDGHDMSMCNVVEVHYINIGSNERHNDVYEIPEEDRETIRLANSTDEALLCTWLLSQNATSLAGTLSFALRFMCTSTGEDGEAIIDYSWGTGIYTKTIITPGINNSEAVVEQYADVLEEWRQQLLSTTSQSANAFVKMVSDKAVRVDDVSPIEHKAKIKVSGKNLVDISNMVSTTSSNNFINNGDGTYTLTKTTDGNTSKRFSAGDKFQTPILANTVFRISCTILENTSNDGLYFAFYDSNDQAIASTSAATIDIKSFSYDIDIHSIRLYLLLNEPDGSYVTIKDLQIEPGDTATEYKPYVDPSSVNVSVFRKNIFPALPETSKDGITLIKVNDYYVLNGTATSSGLITTTKSLPTGTYTLSANNPTHNSLDLAIVQIYSDTTKKSMVAKDNASYSTHTMDIPASNDYQFRIRYENGITYNNYIIKPQLELGSNATNYEQYKEPVLYSTADDGTLEIDSISPTMTVLTDTDSAIRYLTYNRDLNKVMGDVESALDIMLDIQNALIGGAN